MKTALAILAGLAVIGVAVYEYVQTVPDSAPFRTPEANRDMLIAHAGGGIDGETYTNCLEAMELAARNGYRFIELDLMLTKDGKLVAGHAGWKAFNKLIGLDGDEARTLDEVKGRKILGKWTVVTARELNDFFARHPGVQLITDGIRDFAALREQLNFPDRIIIEAYSPWRCRKVLAAGFKHPIFVMASERRLDNHWDNLRPGRISMISVPIELMEKNREKFRELYNRGVTIFVWTSNDAEGIRRDLNRLATAFYTDFVTPGDLRQPEQEKAHP